MKSIIDFTNTSDYLGTSLTHAISQLEDARQLVSLSHRLCPIQVGLKSNEGISNGFELTQFLFGICAWSCRLVTFTLIALSLSILPYKIAINGRRGLPNPKRILRLPCFAAASLTPESSGTYSPGIPIFGKSYLVLG
ncbi:MAG: hypothetical protein KF860_08630 [Cyclobacteriaceae bacterium]|nr:hypothetical protein [Cyclobacteriaceae bacterium]